MIAEGIAKACALAERLGHVFVATADAGGQPHVAAAGELAALGESRVAVSSWFCPGTMANLQASRRISLVVWDPATDTGYQLLGEVERTEELSALDGYAPGEPLVPQLERRLVVRVESALSFTHAPHTDREA